jgi:hypothetical protein
MILPLHVQSSEKDVSIGNQLLWSFSSSQLQRRFQSNLGPLIRLLAFHFHFHFLLQGPIKKYS